MKVTFDIRHGDCLTRLAEMPSESVQCCVTSPPYFGLRAYLPDVLKIKESLTSAERDFITQELERLHITTLDHT